MSRMLPDAAVTRLLEEAAALENWLARFRAAMPAFVPPTPSRAMGVSIARSASSGRTSGRIAGPAGRLPESDVLRTAMRPRAIHPARDAVPGAGDVQALSHPDWLYHHLSVWGPPRRVAEFERAATGAGVVPWWHDHDRLEEDWTYLIAGITAGVALGRARSPGEMHAGRMRLAGARALARRLRQCVEVEHDAALSWFGVGTACPFDLYNLVPIPGDVLVLGPDDAAARSWLWQNWGTTWSLRRVRREPVPPGKRQPSWRVSFWSADWSPWRAVAWLRRDWPELTFELVPRYDNDGSAEPAAPAARAETAQLEATASKTKPVRPERAEPGHLRTRRIRDARDPGYREPAPRSP